jgi:hypothetical protein
VRTPSPVESLPPFRFEKAMDDTAYSRDLAQVDLFLFENIVGAVHKRVFYRWIKRTTLTISAGAADFAINDSHLAANSPVTHRLPNGLAFTCGPAALAGLTMLLQYPCGGTGSFNGLFDGGQ